MENTKTMCGGNIYNFAASIFPICRSLMGNGVRETLSMINEYISGTGLSLNIYEVPTGTSVFDWTIPKEWIIRGGYIENENGEKIVDFENNNLHIMGYSAPVDMWVELDELKKFIYTQPNQLDVIPYVTSYYSERYGFCMSELQKESLKQGKYHMYIDSELRDGSLTYADLVIPGKSDKELMITSYICHPSMANNECSGPALLAELIKYVHSIEDRRYTYRFVLNPETIGSITYLSRNYIHLKEKLVGGVVLSCVGDNRAYSIIESRYADTIADKGLKNILKYYDKVHNYTYLSRGSDERQYNAPGIELPVVGFCRSKYGEYVEYHTSADNMEIVSPEGFQGSYNVMTEWIQAMEVNDYYKVNVLCEPQLGKRGLYPAISQKNSYDSVKAITDFIAYADGTNDIFDISNIIGVPVKEIIPIIERLLEAELIKVVSYVREG